MWTVCSVSIYLQVCCPLSLAVEPSVTLTLSTQQIQQQSESEQRAAVGQSAPGSERATSPSEALSLVIRSRLGTCLPEEPRSTRAVLTLEGRTHQRTHAYPCAHGRTQLSCGTGIGLRL